jgi:uncharacterized protein YdeI (YjbR/CyaY-like superfamily)
VLITPSAGVLSILLAVFCSKLSDLSAQVHAKALVLLGRRWNFAGGHELDGTMALPTDKDEPILQFSTAAKFEAYMAKEPRSSKGCWMKLSKDGSARRTITKQAAIEAALCHGWIDGQLGSFDDQYFLVRMTPRRRGSRWSQKNRSTAEVLLAQGRVHSEGIAEIEAAKSDGRWAAAYASQGKAQVPEDLAAALARKKSALRFFEQLDGANRYSIIYRVNDAKRPETRARRIADFVEMLTRGETIHPPKPTKRSPTRE